MGYTGEFAKRYEARVSVVKPQIVDVNPMANSLIIQLPKSFNGMTSWNRKFIQICDLIVDDSNILTMGFNGENRMVATNSHIADYLGLSEKTIVNMMSSLCVKGIIMKCNAEKRTWYIVNPLFAYHKNGVSDTVIDMFKCIRDDNIAKEMKKILRDTKNAIDMRGNAK